MYSEGNQVMEINTLKSFFHSKKGNNPYFNKFQSYRISHKKEIFYFGFIVFSLKENSMKNRHLFSLLLFLIFPAITFSQEWELIWEENFNTEGPVDSTLWNHEYGFVRNNELQWYQPQNSYCKNGLLIIEGKKEKVENPQYNQNSNDWRRKRPYAEYTSSSINTRGKQEFLYGRIEVKAKIPTQSGAWPAIWTLGREMEWPSNGEVDIMEYYRINDVPHILANAAWGTNQRYNAKWKSKAIPFEYFTNKQPQWSDEFHIWRMDWDKDFIRLYLDDELLNEIDLSETFNEQLGENKNPFRQPHYILLNLAIGGDNGGEPNSKDYPIKYEVDYVKVYQKKGTNTKQETIEPGETWLDNRGIHINAHGGGVLHHNGKYYWYGEHKSSHTSSALVGITCYSSADLINWTYEGVVLAASDDENSEIAKGCVMERPKVIYNEKTKKFVLWFHLELKGKGYAAARYATAISDTPTGSFKYLGSGRVNAKIYPENMPKKYQNKTYPESVMKNWWTPQWKKAVEEGMLALKDFNEGQMSRDMTLFVDNDGKGYHIYSSEENLTLHIAELTDDFLSHTGKYIRIFPGGHNEAPALFNKEGKYWMITSGCTGWDPNEARMFSAPSIWGPWKQHKNPCIGPKAELTFESQSTYILPIQGKKNAYVFMADRWKPKNQIDSRYIWLPIQFNKKGEPYLEWINQWNPNTFF